MKIFILRFSIIIFTLFIISCKKYPEGPTISFISKTERLSNTWRVKQYFENGIDKTNDFNNVFQNYVLTIKKDYTYTLTYKAFGIINYSENGSWAFNSNKTGVIFNNNANNNTTNWSILKLMEKELWGKYIDSNKTIEVHLIP
ncbi:MAG: hypothetical protein HPY79_05505 [Bacteroidales bacterium]|nr:hypothetical protein [Bacteroidales bacterium]